MTNFETISPKNNIPKPSSREVLSQKGLARRDMLKGLAAAAAIATVGPKIVELAKNIDDTQTLSDKDQERLDAAIAEIVARLEPTETQTKIEQRDLSIIGETFAQQIEHGGKIELNQATRNAIYQHHYRDFQSGGKNHEGYLVEGLERMSPWIAEIKTVFKEVFKQYADIPENLMYLAIQESLFKIHASSHKAAVGPYQITEDTANRYHMTVTNDYDERLDPIKSARLCAQHLKDSFEFFGGTPKPTNSMEKEQNVDAWKLAMMDYNGSFTNAYVEQIKLWEKTVDIIPRGTCKLETTISHLAIKHNTSITLFKRANHLSDDQVRKLKAGTELIIPQKREFTFDKFNAWLEQNINNDITLISREHKYLVRPGDILGTIAQKYNEDVTEIKKLNNLNSDNIRVGQELRLPHLEIKLQKAILNKLAEYKENINYPEKFYAIIDVMKKEGLMTKFDAATTTYTEIDPPEESIQHFEYRVKKGDNLLRIINILKKQNPECNLTTNELLTMFIEKNTNIPNKNTVPLNQLIKLDFPLKKPGSLSDIAKTHNIDVAILKELNPAIRNINLPIPNQVRIRIPKEP